VIHRLVVGVGSIHVTTVTSYLRRPASNHCSQGGPSVHRRSRFCVAVVVAAIAAQSNPGVTPPRTLSEQPCHLIKL
jgi:hypothetical protein